MGVLRKYWGFAVLFVVVAAIVNNWFGPPALALLSGATIFYFLFQVPNWCGAINRTRRSGAFEFCRDNSTGVLLGCHRRQHKWQKIKMTFVSEYWRRFAGELRAQPIEGLKTITALLGLVGGFVTLIIALIKL